MTGVTGATPEDGQWRRRVLIASDVVAGSIRMGHGSRSVRGQTFTSAVFLSPKVSLRLAMAQSTS